MRELGRILRTARESCGLDLDEIEAKTKIRKRYLLALEEGDWTVLPGRVYARGFVRSYADILGLDGLELLQKYVDGREYEDVALKSSEIASESKSKALKEDPAPVDKKNAVSTGTEESKSHVDDVAVPPEPSKRRASRDSFERQSQPRQRTGFRVGGAVGQVAIIVAAIVVVGGGYLALRGHGHQGNPPAPPTTNAQGTNTSVLNQASATGVNAVNGTSNLTNSVANTAPVPPAPPVVITAKGLQNGSYTYTVQNVPKLDVTLSIQSSSSIGCWISAQTDTKKTDPNDTVQPGQKRNFKANNSVVLRLGHVQGVEVTVNGKALKLPGTKYAIDVVIQKQGS